MNKNVTKTTIQKVLEVKHGLSPVDAQAMVDDVLDLIKVTLTEGGKVTLLNIGVLYAEDKPAKQMTSFGRKIDVPAKRVFKFRAADKLKGEQWVEKRGMSRNVHKLLKKLKK